MLINEKLPVLLYLTKEGWGSQENYSNIIGKSEGVFLGDSPMVIKQILKGWLAPKKIKYWKKKICKMKPPTILQKRVCHLLCYMVSRHTFWRSFSFDISLITPFLLNHFKSVMKWIVKELINPFLPNIPFWSPWEHQKVFW